MLRTGRNRDHCYTMFDHRSALLIVLIAFANIANAQSARVKGYSESVARGDNSALIEKSASNNSDKQDDGIVRIKTDLVTLPVRVKTRKGRPVPDIQKQEFRLYENGVEQTIEYFSNQEEPFTVALMLDMSYSSVFKLQEIQTAALAFIAQLRPDDRVMVLSFDEKVQVLCEPTADRRILRLAIEATRIGSGTSLYNAIEIVVRERFERISGRKAIVLLSDGVDTTSQTANPVSILRSVDESDILIYPVQFDTFDDVLKSHRNDAQVFYDDDDRPYVVAAPLAKGETEKDYRDARTFLNELADRTGGRVQEVRSTTNLNGAFARIADELRKTYSLGYYPISERVPGQKYFIRIRIYRPGLEIRARENFASPKK